MSRPDYLTRFRSMREEPLADKPIAVLLPKDVDAYVRSLPNKAEWLRSVITEAAQKDRTPDL
ncbi:hypothetical protein [Myxacorys almedinensis]|uniref:Uncharacterized protein n=1 Tax=Myxacorys almedinensis A TaxID=2690445 RepID=A0A8J8CLC9_9CYAN|nr:hypothetical protein [Myxacorys almedinensis]NDJ19476.1 hypothetical protein [Myxacorys almedinensis A]